MAFHLHRLKLVGRPLHAAGYHNADAADIAAARSLLSRTDIDTLAQRVGIPARELTRPLTHNEQREWSFYRGSASNPKHVWNAARDAWKTGGLSEKDAAKIMGVTMNAISAASRRPFALTFPAALKLSTALTLPGGPEALLPPPKRNTDEPNR